MKKENEKDFKRIEGEKAVKELKNIIRYELCLMRKEGKETAKDEEIAERLREKGYQNFEKYMLDAMDSWSPLPYLGC